MRRWLEDQLRRNAWKVGEKIPGESVLARNLEVSAITVRQALNALAKEGALRRERGRGTFVTRSWPATAPTSATANGDGSRPDNTLKDRTVGVLIPVTELSVRKLQIIEALEQGISARGGRTRVMPLTPGQDPGLESVHAAVIIEHESLGFARDALALLDGRQLPVVACDYLGPQCVHRVVEDLGWGMRMAVQHLCAQGCRALILAEFYRDGMDWRGMEWMSTRAKAFLETCVEYGLPANPSRILKAENSVGNLTEQVDAGRQIAVKILDEGIPCTGLIGVTDYVAIGALREIRRRHARISVMGFDNIPEAGIENLTTMAPPSARQGAAAIDLLEILIERSIGGTEQYYQSVLRPHLVCRESTSIDFSIA